MITNEILTDEESGVHPQSLYSLLARDDFGNVQIPRNIKLPMWNWKPGLFFGGDNGNFKFKGTVAHAEKNTYSHSAILAATGPVPTALTKISYTKYCVYEGDLKHSSDWFLIGRDALNLSPQEQLSLGVGATAERLHDPRQKQFILASIVETLVDAQYRPDTYHLVFGFGAPNDEFVDGDITEALADALEVFNGKTFMVKRVHGGEVETYTLVFAEVIPTPQTSGSFVALNYSPKGELLDSPFMEDVIVDFGGGHTQEYNAKRIRNGRGEMELVGTGGKLGGIGKGTILLAREASRILKLAHSNIDISDIASQVALADNIVKIRGQEVPLDKALRDAQQLLRKRDRLANRADMERNDDRHPLDETVNAMLTDTLKILQNEAARVVFTGGGLSLELLRNALIARSRKVRTSGILFPTPSLAARLSSYGLHLTAAMVSYANNRQG